MGCELCSSIEYDVITRASALLWVIDSLSKVQKIMILVILKHTTTCPVDEFNKFVILEFRQIYVKVILTRLFLNKNKYYERTQNTQNTQHEYKDSKAFHSH